MSSPDLLKAKFDLFDVRKPGEAKKTVADAD